MQQNKRWIFTQEVCSPPISPGIGPFFRSLFSRAQEAPQV